MFKANLNITFHRIKMEAKHKHSKTLGNQNLGCKACKLLNFNRTATKLLSNKCRMLDYCYLNGKHNIPYFRVFICNIDKEKKISHNYLAVY